ncbi:MAG: hypothetical protein II921_05180 [Treponema sp.]|nr:hypothetical protein [Treponema sp.]
MQTLKKVNLEDVPFLVKHKKLSYREATDTIWEKLYLSPKSFGLNDLTEDERSDFLILFINKIESIINQFLTLSFSISFKTYLKKCVTNAKQSWLRKKIIRNVNDQAIESFAHSECESDIHKYEIKDVEIAVMEQPPTFAPEHTSNRRRRVAEMAALVLTMKACQDVDDELIEKVADFTGFDTDFIHEKVLELKEQNCEKEKKRELLVRRRDNSFYFRRRYQIELSRVNQGTKTQSELAEKFTLHGKNWQKNNEILNKINTSAPSADQIALTLGMRPRQVRFYISHIKQPENAEKIKTMVKKAEKEDTDDAGEKNSMPGGASRSSSREAHNLSAQDATSQGT